MELKCISTFNEDIELLTGRSKHGYSSVCLDIKKHFQDLSFESFLNNSLCIFDSEEFRIFKIRLPNSGQNIGKSGGFRLICLADKRRTIPVLLHIYPKKGKYGKDDIDDKQLLLIAETYTAEMNNILDWDPDGKK